MRHTIEVVLIVLLAIVQISMPQSDFLLGAVMGSILVVSLSAIIEMSYEVYQSRKESKSILNELKVRKEANIRTDLNNAIMNIMALEMKIEKKAEELSVANSALASLIGGIQYDISSIETKMAEKKKKKVSKK